jgi:hypothetical protein
MGTFLSVAGLAVVVVAIVWLFGRAHWAHTASRRLALLVLAAGTAITVASGALAGCSTPQPSSPGLSPASTNTASVTSPAPATQGPTSPPPAPTPASSPTGTLRWRGSVALPDHRLTPGAVFRRATAYQVCTPGWAGAHRDVPEEVRYSVFAEYGLPYGVHDAYEVDHLIPLELGGSNSIRNLWPQPEGGSRPGYPAKDRLEDHLHHLVCAGNLALATAQHAIATNWWAAYKTYIGSPAPHQPASPAPPPAPAPAPSTGGVPVVHPGAFCSDAGAHGVTTAGTPMVCKTTATDIRLRWRAA